MIRNFDSIESVRNPNHYDFYYESVVGDRVISAIPSYVKLETSLMSYAFLKEEKELGNYRLDALGTEEEELNTTYNLRTFSMRVQSLNRTLIDIVWAGRKTRGRQQMERSSYRFFITYLELRRTSADYA